jgi:radical SAM protein with 4Fe4S-binding SPASM domain
MSVDMNIDGHKLHLHPDKAAHWLKTGDCYPIHIEIGVTALCDHDCVFCALDFVNDRDRINKEVMLSALEDMARHEVRSVMFGGEGEPLLHPQIGLFVRKAKEFGLDVAITTNGTSFNAEKRKACLPYLSWVKFSVDAGTPRAYAEIHRVPERKYAVLLENIRESATYKRKHGLRVTIGTQFLMVPAAMPTIETAVKILRDAGADYVSVKPYSQHPRSINRLVVDPSVYGDLEDKLKGFSSETFKVHFRKAMIAHIDEGNAYPECYGLSFISLVDSKGNVLPCNLFYGMPEFTYGNLYEQSFSEIWEGVKRKEVLARLRQKGVRECRHGCRCDAANRYLYRLKEPQPHDNFT